MTGLMAMLMMVVLLQLPRRRLRPAGLGGWVEQ
jgi:hypothetical protein